MLYRRVALKISYPNGLTDPSKVLVGWNSNKASY